MRHAPGLERPCRKPLDRSVCLKSKGALRPNPLIRTSVLNMPHTRRSQGKVGYQRRIHVSTSTYTERSQIGRQLYRDLRRGKWSGRRFEPKLSNHASRPSCFLARFTVSSQRSGWRSPMRGIGIRCLIVTPGVGLASSAQTIALPLQARTRQSRADLANQLRATGFVSFLKLRSILPTGERSKQGAINKNVFKQRCFQRLPHICVSLYIN